MLILASRWNGQEPVPVVNGIKGKPCPSVALSGSVYLPTTIRAQAPAQLTETKTMRVCTKQHRFYWGSDRHARTMYLWRSHGGDDTVDHLVLLHCNCHRQVQSQRLVVDKAVSERGVREGLSRLRENAPVRF
jgi:hypothetical protein